MPAARTPERREHPHKVMPPSQPCPADRRRGSVRIRPDTPNVDHPRIRGPAALARFRSLSPRWAQEHLTRARPGSPLHRQSVPPWRQIIRARPQIQRPLPDLSHHNHRGPQPGAHSTSPRTQPAPKHAPVEGTAHTPHDALHAAAPTHAQEPAKAPTTASSSAARRKRTRSPLAPPAGPSRRSRQRSQTGPCTRSFNPPYTFSTGPTRRVPPDLLSPAVPMGA
ncbi:hypothetical protein E3G68_005243 [Mycobacteroides abscessus]|nr:hypothetical protein [Mycobacteroides abscessus]